MIDVVIPTIGRPSLAVLLASIAAARGHRPNGIILVDDRKHRDAPLETGPLDPDMSARLVVLDGAARGPAAARNRGWRASRARWIAFLDDDVRVHSDWLEALARDLERAGREPDVAGSQGCVHVPLPAGRKPTDWERNVAGLETSLWITADCAYRRDDLVMAGGFDERFPRAFREDADLALRIVARGKRIVRGTRGIDHPVRPAPWSISIRLQAGNADDVLMDALHGSAWREHARAPRGAFRAHVVTVAAAATAIAAATAWVAATAAFAWRRIAPGPRTRDEVVRMAVTSAVIPFAAVFHRLRAQFRVRDLLAEPRGATNPVASAVFFDRDGTLIADLPSNADPSLVTPMPHARAALDRLRGAGVLTAVVSNQPGIALGAFTRADADAINARTETLLGPLGPVFMCAHAPDDGCACRKPAPGLIVAAARALGVDPKDCVVVGDIGSDVEAARAAGARPILVATSVTLQAEIASAPLVARDLAEAVDLVLAGMA